MTDDPVVEQERRAELASFLRARRTGLRPEQVGLPAGTRRRTPGLRREEVALLAGVGTTWYTWLEQGRDIRVSTEMLENLVRVLRLDGDERAYLFTLARRPLLNLPTAPVEPVRSTLRALLDTFDSCPAHIRNTQWDVLAWNRAEALIADWATIPEQRRNAVWHHFTDPVLRDRFVDWEGESRTVLALFRMENGHRLGDAQLADLVQRLEAASPEFRTLWPQQHVQRHREEPMEFDYPRVGQLLLERVILHIALDPPLTLRVLVPLPGTDAGAKLRTLLKTI